MAATHADPAVAIHSSSHESASPSLIRRGREHLPCVGRLVSTAGERGLEAALERRAPKELLVHDPSFGDAGRDLLSERLLHFSLRVLSLAGRRTVGGGGRVGVAERGTSAGSWASLKLGV